MMDGDELRGASGLSLSARSLLHLRDRSLPQLRLRLHLCVRNRGQALQQLGQERAGLARRVTCFPDSLSLS